MNTSPNSYDPTETYFYAFSEEPFLFRVPSMMTFTCGSDGTFKAYSKHSQVTERTKKQILTL
ncbi:hypothetical protein HMI54_013598, partial [Coelomomyces lativittatus]